MREERGITLITLVVTIVVMLLLSGVVIYNGTKTIQTTKKTVFISELEMIQAKVDTIYERRKLGQKEIEYYDALGEGLEGIDSEVLKQALGGTSKQGFRYFSRQSLEDLELENITQEVIINYDTREVISLTGIELEGVRYYKLSEIPNYIGYQPKTEEQETNPQIQYEVEVERLENTWRYRIVNIQTPQGVAKETISYKLHGTQNWMLLKGDSFEILKPGLYDIKVTDKAGNSKVVQTYSYVTKGRCLYLDGENNTGEGHSNTITLWKDLSGNGEDGVLTNFSNTMESGWTTNGLKFDGIDDIVVISGKYDYAKWKAGVPFSFGVTITLPDVAIGQYQGIFSNIRDWGNGGVNLQYGTQQGISIGTGSYLSSGITPKSGESYVIYGVYDGTNMSIYINGILAKTEAIDLVAGESKMNLGCSTIQPTLLMNGTIHQIQFYDRALTQQEVKANYMVETIRNENLPK